MRSAVESSGRGRRRRRSPKARECENLLSVEPAARACLILILGLHMRDAPLERRVAHQIRRVAHYI